MKRSRLKMLFGLAFAAVFAPSILAERATWERIALDRVSRPKTTTEEPR